GFRMSDFGRLEPTFFSDYPVAELFKPVDQQIRRIGHQRLRLKSVRDAAGLHTRVARRADIYAAVAHHHGAIERGLALRHQRLNADRMGLFWSKLLPAETPRKCRPSPSASTMARLITTGLLVSTAIRTPASSSRSRVSRTPGYSVV